MRRLDVTLLVGIQQNIISIHIYIYNIYTLIVNIAKRH